MSLDVYLYEGGEKGRDSSGIFVRDAGAVRELSRAEWDERFPGVEPVIAVGEPEAVYWRNITHNLGRMAEAADLYKWLWRPDENGIDAAGQLIKPLTCGLAALRADPEKYRAYEPGNGWGDYRGLVEFVADYLAACRRHPTARVEVSR